MRELKESNIEWIGKIPKNWRVFKVKNAFFIRKEKAKLKNPVVLSLARNGINIRDIKNNEGQIAESYFDYNLVKKGDLLLNPMDLYSGANCNVSNVNGVISQAYTKLVGKKQINPYFYDYFFKTQYWSMAFFAHGKGVSFENRWTLNNETLKNYFIPQTSYNEQTKIVNFLDNKVALINSIISKTKESIEYYKQYKQSLITEVVTKGLNPNAEMKDSGIEWIGKIPKEWKVLRLKDIFFFQKGLPITKDNLTKTGIKVISYGQIHNTKNEFVKIVDELFRYVSPIYIKSNKSSLVNFGEYIFADTSEDLQGVGNFVLMDKENEPIFAGYHTIILKNKNFNNLYLKKYLGYLFLTDNWRDQIRSRVNGVKLFSITQKILSKVQIIIPPLTEQGIIVDKLDLEISKINKLIDNKNKIMIELEDYKKSLIYEVVTGKKEIN